MRKFGPGIATFLCGLLIFALAATALPPVIPAASKDSEGEQLKALLARSGFDAQLAEVPGMMASQLRQQGNKMPTGEEKQVAEAMESAFALERLRATVLTEVRTRYHAGHMEQTMAFLDSPLGKRLVALEVAASTPEGLEKVAEYGRNMAEQPPAEARVNLMLRIDEAASVTEASLNMFAVTLLAMISAMQEFVPEEKRMSGEDMEAFRDQLRQQTAQLFLSQTLTTFLYAYQDVPEADLEKYITFLESPAGQWYQTTLQEALIKAIADSSTAFGRKVRQLAESTRRTT